jgi:hypothetical protein
MSRSKLSRNNRLREIRVDDLMQKGCVYAPREPPGKHLSVSCP